LPEIRAIDGLAHNLSVRKFRDNGTAYFESNDELRKFIANVHDNNAVFADGGEELSEFRAFLACSLMSVNVATLLRQKVENDIPDGISLAVTSNSMLKKMGVSPWSHLTWGDEGHSGFLFRGKKASGSVEERDLWPNGFVGKMPLSAKEMCQVKVYHLDVKNLLENCGVAGELRKEIPDYEQIIGDKFKEVLEQVTQRTYGYKVSTFSVIVLFFAYFFNVIFTFFGRNKYRGSDIAEYFTVDRATGKICYTGPADEKAFRTRLCYCSGYLMATVLASMKIVNDWFINWHLPNSGARVTEEQRRALSDPNFSLFRPLIAPGVYVPAMMTLQVLESFEQKNALKLMQRKNVRDVVRDYPIDA
jgi:hypothetical protein